MPDPDGAAGFGTPGFDGCIPWLSSASSSSRSSWPAPADASTRRRRCPLVVAGLALGIPAASGSLQLNPELVLGVALPPLLFAQALNTSYVGIRKNRRPVLLLSIGLVIFTAATVAVSGAGHRLRPLAGGRR